MVHLTATRSASQAASKPVAIVVREDTGPRFRAAAAQSSPKPAGSDFCCHAANLLEMARSGFHYSVIGHDVSDLAASAYIGWAPLNDEEVTSKSEVDVPSGEARRFPSPAHAQNGDEWRLNHLWTGRTFGPTKEGLMRISAEFGYHMPLDVTNAKSSMRRIGENIPATSPLSAAVAPILHVRFRTHAVDRGTTPNNGAAA